MLSIRFWAHGYLVKAPAGEQHEKKFPFCWPISSTANKPARNEDFGVINFGKQSLNISLPALWQLFIWSLKLKICGSEFRKSYLLGKPQDHPFILVYRSVHYYLCILKCHITMFWLAINNKNTFFSAFYGNCRFFCFVNKQYVRPQCSVSVFVSVFVVLG